MDPHRGLGTLLPHAHIPTADDGAACKGMQFFNFIFLARSWAADRLYLASRLAFLGKRAEQSDKPFSLILYPEGTLVSEKTRPVSKKYADKKGIVCPA
jgi:hypothetical protein